ncbi:hypothetical protein [Peteryoungia ipomoeae]|uniref:Lipoprotein n=1 Tax=Peteryoungia ipomoeae TaxID=1210932 RepID=A0A4S8P749_9HYPH|nr:hypothetical protein [Peteryoungia ipomoeae]THV25341.1 hypothetical protein FAA97_03855 [Peteryoungia ipomoeae]
MPGRSVYWIVIACAVFSLTACVAFPGTWNGRPLVYNVRTATILANGDVHLDLLTSLDRRIASAIATTRPPPGAERVVLLIKLDRLTKGFNARRNLDRAHVTVTASSVETGEPVAEAKLVVDASTDDPRYGREQLAEQIAARIRYAFSLTTPRLRVVRHPPKISTILATEAPVAARTSVTTVQPQAAKPVRAPRSATVDDGASGAVRLGADCDAVGNADCLVPQH